MQQAIEKLRERRLRGFIDAVREQLESSQYQQLSFDERFSMIVEREYLDRKSKRMRRAITRAQLKQQATVDDIDFETPRKLKRNQFLELSTGNWIRSKHNLVIVGPTGIGKSYFACALADKPCKLGYQARYFRINSFLVK